MNAPLAPFGATLIGTVSAVQPVATVTVGRSVTVQVAPTAVTGSGEWRSR